MQNFMFSAAGAIFGLCFILGIWHTSSVWNECRATNSFFYCLKLISR